MTPELWQRVSQALGQADELTTAQWPEFLDRLRDSDAEVAAEVESLLQGGTEPLERARARLLPLLAATATATAVPAPPPAQEEWPSRVGPYAVAGELARGGMGVVLRATDPKFNRLVAVKILAARYAQSKDLARRFREEALITGQLQHPGIPPVYDVGQLPDGRPFLAMKLIQGQTLAKLLEDTSHRDLPRLLGIFEQVCQTMAYAHARGVLHRDLKPSNIMVGKFGEVQVMDWGLVKVLAHAEGITHGPHESQEAAAEDGAAAGQQDTSATQPGSVLGTPAYMSPEQARGEIDCLDERCDVFGLGAMLCEILTGWPAYCGQHTDELIGKAIAADLDDCRRRLGACGADPDLIGLAERCLEPDPAARLRNAGEAARAITAYLSSVQARLQQAQMDRAQADARAEEAQKRRRVERQKRRMTLALAASVLLLVLGAAASSLWYVLHQAEQAQKELESRTSLVEQLKAALEQEQRDAKELEDQLDGYATAELLTSDLGDWRRRLQKRQEALDRAKLALESSPVAVGEPWAERLERWQQTLKLDRQAHDLARELDAIQLDSFMAALEERWNPTGAGPKYAAFFRKHLALDIEASAVRRRMAAVLRKAPLRHVLVAALDYWAELSQHPESNYKDLLPVLLEMAMRADQPDPWRGQFRQEAVWHNRDKLEQLARAVQPRTQSAQILMALANQLERSGGKGVGLLQTALLHYPRNFWLYLTTAHLLKNPGEKTGYCQAALVVRPDNPVACYNLGKALLQFRKMEEAVAAFEKIIDKNAKYPSVGNHLGLAHAALGKALMQQVRFPEALRDFREARKWLALEAARDLEDPLKECERCVEVQAREAQLPTEAKVFPATIAGALHRRDPLDFYPYNESFYPYRSSYRKCHVVALQGGRSYQIDLHSTAFDTLLRVESSDWRPLVFNDDCGPLAPANHRPDATTDSRIVFTPGKDGMYRLIVTSVGRGGKTGAYTLHLHEVAPARRSALFRGELNSSSKSGDGKYDKTHAITLTAGTPYVFELGSPDFDTYLQLLDSSGKVVAYNDDIAPDERQVSRIDFTPRQNGHYVLRVTSYFPGEMGNYTLTIQGYRPLE